MTTTKAYAAASAKAPLAPLSIQRRTPGPSDVQIDILYCGICHSDLHTARDEWNRFMPTVYPCVPGHEIVGRVAKVGGAVKAHKVGDLVAVGCLVDSDRTCPQCQANSENLCANGVFTYNAPDKHTGGVTYGGYSERIVVDEHFVLRVPKNLSLPGVAPLLCAGITTWSPLRRALVQEGHKVGIVGLGGLGHMGVKLSHALGAHTVVLTTSPGKKDDAKRLGADDVIVTRNVDEMAKHAGSFDFLLDTVSADHDLDALLALLTHDGTLTLVGAPAKPLSVSSFSLLMGRRKLAGSLIGGIRETQEMLDFCGEHGITSDVEVIPVRQVNQAYERLLKGDVRYRFVLDMATLQGG